MEPIVLTAKANNPQLIKVKNIVANFSNYVVGAISPYPTVTIVMKEKYMLSK